MAVLFPRDDRALTDDLDAQNKRLNRRLMRRALVFGVIWGIAAGTLGGFLGSLQRSGNMHLVTAPFERAAAFILQYAGFITYAAVLVIITAATGTLLYLLRCRNLSYYAGLEWVVGISTGTYVLTADKNAEFGFFFGWMAAVYVIVRAHDNFHKAHPDKVWWNRVFFGPGS